MLTFEATRIQNGGFFVSADLRIAAAARVAVIGPSGAGKSTLLLALAGFCRVVEGRIAWRDQSIDGLEPAQRPVSIVFQDNNLFPHLTAFQNVALGVDPALRLSDEQITAVERALSRVGLAGKGGRKPASLSGGQQSRVTLARVLLRRKPILLLDEPFAALGPALRREMLDLVAALAEEERLTMIMVSHDPADALHLAPETVLVADGIAAPPQPTKALLENPPPALAAYLGR